MKLLQRGREGFVAVMCLLRPDVEIVRSRWDLHSKHQLKVCVTCLSVAAAEDNTYYAPMVVNDDVVVEEKPKFADT